MNFVNAVLDRKNEKKDKKYRLSMLLYTYMQIAYQTYISMNE